jgi:hypothetical protein
LDQSVFVFGWDCPVHQTLSGTAVQASHPATIKLTHYRAFRLDV